MFVRLLYGLEAGRAAVYQGKTSETDINASTLMLAPSQVPLHTLIKLTPVAYGCLEERYPLPIAAVDTHRPKQVRKSAISSPTDGVDTATSPAAVNRDYFGSGLIQKLANETIKEESHEETVVEAGNDSAKDVADLKAQEGAARQSGVEAAKGEIS